MLRLPLAVMCLLVSVLGPAAADTLQIGDGITYVGDVRHGVQHGRGIQTWPNGNRYEGEWQNGDHHGSGVFTWSGGESYRGQWKAGRWHGKGTYTKADGTVLSGEWKNSFFANGTAISPDGKKRKWKNGFPE